MMAHVIQNHRVLFFKTWGQHGATPELLGSAWKKKTCSGHEHLLFAKGREKVNYLPRHMAYVYFTLQENITTVFLLA